MNHTHVNDLYDDDECVVEFVDGTIVDNDDLIRFIS